MANILRTDPQAFITSLADALKKEKLVTPVEWSVYVKTGHHKQRQPDSNDWWYARASAILRSIYRLGPIGTQKLRTKFGGNKNRGHRPNKQFKASGSIIRKILQQLETSGMIKQVEKGVHKGRIITAKGEAFMNDIAKRLNPDSEKVVKKVKKAKVQKKVEKTEVKEEAKVEEKTEPEVTAPEVEEKTEVVETKPVEVAAE
ncbi:MAG: 30S ribosomal protein S19e [Nanoarchaeota archaeon]|nr:30S ribosomal protein S19e [Nanoarchaeota archaeon]MAG60224.1 30S ribosomal protein S19e [archaeon]|tara:strand:- start:107 stop:709 length:603 start_codon:yes stop_codon:yes gene_type:complete